MPNTPLTGFTTADLARRWNRSPDRVRQLARSGRLHPVMVTASGQRIFDESEIIRFERERELQMQEKATA